MKKIMNDVQNIVQDMMHGFYFEHNDKVNYDETNNIIYVKDIEKNEARRCHYKRRW